MRRAAFWISAAMAHSIVTIDDLSNDDIEAVFGLADRFLADMSPEGRLRRIRGRCSLAQDHVLATLFYEPSTRTRLSFESAMLRLGGQYISCADSKVTSTVKGETIADTVRVVESYADLIVIRHPWEGAAQVAADYVDVPVINAGDGGHEHPTQTLCDLYTLRVGDGRAGRRTLKDMTVVLCGDLRHGRTVHSLVYALARLGARVIPLPASPDLDFPEHVRRRLSRDYNFVPLDVAELPDASLPADVLYITPEKPHQLSLLESDALNVSIKLLTKKEQQALRDIKGVDAFYATRLQVERKEGDAGETSYPVIDREFLKQKPYRHSQVMHPLPRVDELGYDVDEDARSVYFQQAANGVPVRMALIASLLELVPAALAGGAGRRTNYRVYERPNTLRCSNANCVTAQPSEQRYLGQKFWLVGEAMPTVRCAYCDYEQEPKVISSARSKRYRLDVSSWKSISADDLALFESEAQALAAGYQAKKLTGREATATQSI
jgi:aspartate carbamoyltransferase catalytic subunit